MPYHGMNYSYLGKQVCHLPLILAGMFRVGGGTPSADGSTEYSEVLNTY